MYTILIVEDDLFFQNKIKDLLLKKIRNIEILTSSKGQDALEIALSVPIDLFIIDIKLPDGDGIQLSRELRKTYRHTPIIIESCLSNYKLQVRVYDEIENIAYLTKPYKSEKLICKVKSALALINKTDTRRLILKHRATTCSILTKQIVYIESVNNQHTIRITMFDEDESQLNTEEFYGVTLKEMLSKLEDLKDFCRCHKSFIVNISKIKRIESKLIYFNHIEQPIPLGNAYKSKLMEGFHELEY